LSHQQRDAYWKHGSVCEDFEAIDIPVYVVGGWADGYTNAVPRLLAGLPGPKKGLIGPWAHHYPEVGSPGPAIGFLQESLRWWDYWLKEIDTGIMNEPMLRSWIQEGQPPQSYYAERPGHWVADPAWPSPQIRSQAYTLNAGPAAGQLDGLLAETASETVPVSLRGSQTTGLYTGAWASYGLPGEFPADQQPDDGKSLSFTSAPLAAPVDILGFPLVKLTVAVDQPAAFLAVRLCDVAPDGASALVSWGVLNLTHRDNHEFPTPLTPGEPVTVTISLNMIGYRLPAGHRWRVAISPTHWPLIWPSRHPVTVTLFAGQASQLILPVRPAQLNDQKLAAFAPPEVAPALPVEVLRTEQMSRQKQVDMSSGKLEIKNSFDFGRIRYSDNGLEFEDITTDTYTIDEHEPLSASVRCERRLAYQRGDWQVRIETSSIMTADADHFYVTNLLDAYEGNSRVFTKSWTFKTPRNLV
jgi:predicted acyl esterase